LILIPEAFRSVSDPFGGLTADYALAIPIQKIVKTAYTVKSELASLVVSEVIRTVLSNKNIQVIICSQTDRHRTHA